MMYSIPPLFARFCKRAYPRAEYESMRKLPRWPGDRALKEHFSTVEADDDRGISETRGLACELVAWRFVTHFNEREAIDFLCYDLPIPSNNDISKGQPDGLDGAAEQRTTTERTPLLNGTANDPTSDDEDLETSDSEQTTAFGSAYVGLNALEIAAVANAKKFLSQKAILRIIDGIWKGDIVFWDTLSQHSVKQARVYNKHKSDPFSRLRVPLYLKIFELLFFAVFIALYYIVLVQKQAYHISASEILLYIWLAAFTYNGLSPIQLR